MRRPTSIAAAAVLALAAAGCGAAEERSQSTAASASDRVEIVLQPRGPQGQTLRKTLSCTSVTADCKKLRAADFSELKDQACTQQYGGPGVATVTGKAGGAAVDATFKLTNGCEIARWERFAWLLGEPPTPG